ncbi:MAG: DNA methyltransferase [Rikenellaceae bacterium]
MSGINYSKTKKELLQLAATTNEQELIYDLLRIFSGVTATSINRIKDGKGNKSKQTNTVVAEFHKRPTLLVAYRYSKTAALETLLEELKTDKKIASKAPRLYIVSDGNQILAHDPIEFEDYDNNICQLHQNFEFFMPLAGIERLPQIEENEADVKAAYEMAKLYDDICRNNQLSTDQEIQTINVFLTRLLFCLFAEDTGIFESQLFTNAVNRDTANDGSDLAEFLEGAFDMMNIESPIIRKDSDKRFSQFPYVNGGLFQKHYPIPRLSRRTRAIILKCGNLDWAEINPDIFGSLLQAVVRPDERASLGQHYTSVPNILKLIQPLFLDELYEAYAKAQHDETKLEQLLIRLSQIKIFDPACGSGNFLIIAYKELRKLEVQIWERLLQLRPDKGILPLSHIKLSQFYGIEYEEFAHETAILALWLSEHQMNQVFSNRFKVYTAALPLRASGRIELGNSCRIDWKDVCPCDKNSEIYIVGNPPYLGSKRQSKEQKQDLYQAFEGEKCYKSVDYIAAWFILASHYIQNTNTKAAFVSTNSICQGEQVAMLWPLIFTKHIDIIFAYTSFKWKNNAKYNAGVTCVIVGLATKGKHFKRIYRPDNTNIEVKNINPYLSAGKNSIVKKSTKLPKFSNYRMKFGCMPYDEGHLILSNKERKSFIDECPNAIRFIKRLIGSAELLKGTQRFCFWISDNDLDEARQYPLINERITKTAYFREFKCLDKATGRELAKKAHQFREYITLSDAIIIPSVSSENRVYIPIDYLNTGVVISNAAFAIYDAPMWLFAVLTSKMHNLWVRTVGGALETRLRYSATLCYNTFPFPEISERQKNELTELAREVILTREEFIELPLGKMYDFGKMPEKLLLVHLKLDAAIEACYKPKKPFHTDEERLDCLFKLYDEMTTNS